MKTLKKILYFLSATEKKKAILLFGMVLVMALLDMLGIASIMPFIAVLGNPDLIETNNVLNSTYMLMGNYGIKTHVQFLFVLGILVFILLVISLAFKGLTTYAQLRFTLMREYSIGKRMVEGHLHQPYSWFLSRHSSDLGKTILSEVGQVIDLAIVPMMTFIAQSTVALAIFILLILIDLKLALIVGFTLSIAYILIYKTTRRFLNHIGKEKFIANEKRFKAINEAFTAAKEVKVGGLEEVYIKRFSDPAQIYARHQASAQIVSQLPRYAMEAIAFGGIILLVLALIARSGNFFNALPIISLYAFAGYRLMPAIQQIYSASTQLRFVEPVVDALYKDFVNLKSKTLNDNTNTLSIKNSIVMNHVHFNYPNSQRTTLKDINLIIPAKSTVGLIGETGSGKTTTVDLILGLLEAQEGTLEVDGQVINDFNRRSWQRSIGYVPQQVFLADDTIASNIAFGIDPKDINKSDVEYAAKVANLDEFIKGELPQQYNTTVGERGIRLSGGQRQRIGIARALYHKPQLLILDEATSALDSLTEQRVMECIQKLNQNVTTIIIAHRLSTLKDCDIIFLLEKGKLKAKGDFNEIVKSNPHIINTKVDKTRLPEEKYL